MRSSPYGNDLRSSRAELRHRLVGWFTGYLDFPNANKPIFGCLKSIHGQTGRTTQHDTGTDTVWHGTKQHDLSVVSCLFVSPCRSLSTSTVRRGRRRAVSCPAARQCHSGRAATTWTQLEQRLKAEQEQRVEAAWRHRRRRMKRLVAVACGGTAGADGGGGGAMAAHGGAMQGGGEKWHWRRGKRLAAARGRREVGRGGVTEEGEMKITEKG